MGKRFDCHIDGCHATILADSHDGVMARAQAHATEAHPDLAFDVPTFRTIAKAVQEA